MQDSSVDQMLIASYRGDLVWLQHCLRSLSRFAARFRPPVVSVSFEDLEATRWIIQKTYPAAIPFVWEIPRPYSAAQSGYGMMRAMHSMMHADLLCPHAANIYLVGSDCLATRPIHPFDYLGKRGEPIVLMNSYEHLREIHIDAVPWRDGTARILGYTPAYEFMRRLPSVFHRSTFLETRNYIERLHGVPFNAYWYDGYASGQRGQSEANLLGAYAYEFQRDLYDFQPIDFPASPVPANPLLQFWSHGGLDRPIDIHYELKGHDIHGRLPRDIIAEVLGDCHSVIP